ncbi:glycosyltransferase family 2 protein [Cryobacterium sandaracinum]|uniref:Glycosyltransferase family 2 protein n=1 Tax=Cryobacterium sandaracinum TaxID=1259247 RepID=A0ABY2JHA0_9MICO|nr:glycosyltransferase family 2 protein [Cryobacterium sandaracinum]TFD05753.1 glycosyltransferase family 2 protein [Cryobacterium sandaracinum]
MIFLNKIKLRVMPRVKRAVKRRLLGGKFRSKAFRFGVVSGREIPVLMCLWNRPERINDVLRLLDEQDFADGIELFLWNNNRTDHATYLEALASFTARHSLKRVTIAKTPFNLGSIGRFYWARKLALAGQTGPLVVIDDDENFTADFISTCVASYHPRVASGWWAFAVGESYYDRAPSEIGGRVDHVGPGGMVCNAEFFRDPKFFTTLPEQFWMLDDLWFSYFVKQRGYSLAKLPVEIEFVLAESNQHHTQADLKREFFDFLYPR